MMNIILMDYKHVLIKVKLKKKIELSFILTWVPIFLLIRLAYKAQTQNWLWLSHIFRTPSGKWHSQCTPPMLGDVNWVFLVYKTFYQNSGGSELVLLVPVGLTQFIYWKESLRTDFFWTFLIPCFFLSLCQSFWNSSWIPVNFQSWAIVKKSYLALKVSIAVKRILTDFPFYLCLAQYVKKKILL